jgi:sodium transport system permease protein
MNLHAIFTVYRKELRDTLRDRRTLISTILIPTIAMPLLFFGFAVVAKKMERKNQAESSSIMVLGVPDTAPIIQALRTTRDEEQNIPLFRIVPAADNHRQLIADKRLKAALVLPANFEEALQREEPFDLVIHNYQGEQSSGLATRRLQDFLGKLREKTVQERLARRSLPANVIKPFEVKRENVAPPERVGGNLFGGLIPYMIIILCFTGAMYPAIDLTAGEKERGTMETLLCCAAHRLDLVLGKFLVIVTASVATILFSLGSMGVSTFLGIAYFSATGKAPAAQAAAAKAGSMMPTIDPVGLIGVFGLVAPVAVLFAAILMAIALAAKSNKEAQSYATPLIMVIILPAMMGMMPGIELTTKTALIPILNVSLACKEMLSGVWHWGYLALIFGSTAAVAATAIALCVWMFNREEVMFRA